MHRAAVAFVCIAHFFSCGSESEKSRAENLNEEKFRHHRQTEAHFVIDVLDTYYGLRDVAKIGEERMRDQNKKQQIREIIQDQTSSMMKLKAYADERGIVIPFAGPEKSKGSVRKLTNKKENDFSRAWVSEMKELQHRLKSDIESYQKKSSDTALLHVLDRTLLMVKTNNERISRLESSSRESI
jgi:hypothetical protein